MKFSTLLSVLGLSALASTRSLDSRQSTSAAASLGGPNCKNTATSRGCWGGGFNINTDYENSWPTTGHTVVYSLTITNITLYPDGIPHLALAVNGQVPGPTIEANWGDYIQVTVTNAMQNNGTSMHWHGIRQLYSNDQDGVNGVTECPLAPGDSKTYTFQATQYGTSWYHSHFSAQYGDGVVGPIVINGPTSANYDIDLGPITVSDSYDHTAYQEDYFAEHTGPPTATNYLLNGQNIRPDGSAGTRPSWTFKQGKKYLIRFINTSIDNHFKVQIDDHTMTVVSADFVPITPYNTTSIDIGIGQRYDVVVTANQPVAGYYLRAIAQVSCSSNLNSGLGNANGIIKYQGAGNVNKNLPNTTYFPYTDACQDEPHASLVPVVSKTVPSTTFASQVSDLPVGGPSRVPVGNDTVFRWYLNGVSQDIDWSNPTLAQVAAGNTTFANSENIITLPTAGAWTFWVIQNQFFVPHPMHLHGHDFSILGQGSGTFTSSDVSSLNFDNPPRRDVTLLISQGWTLIAFLTDNPGSWLMHCHIAYHVGEGLSLQFLEIPSQIPSRFGPKGTEFKQTCNKWDRYIAKGPVYNKTDSGLKHRDLETVNSNTVRGLGLGGDGNLMGNLHSHKHHVRRSLGHSHMFSGLDRI